MNPMPIKVPRERVLQRLEAMLPGFGRFSARRDAERRASRGEITARLHPDRVYTQAATSYGPDIDSLLEFAEDLGLLRDRIQLAEDFEGVEVAQLASLVLVRMPKVREEILVVSDRLDCYSVCATRLSEFITRDVTLTGECSLDGDEIFVCGSTLRVVVLHHAGWIFTIGTDW
jgi:hypothetical protein